MRIIGMDYGSKTLGISLSDETLLIANPIETIRYNTKEELFDKIDKYFNEYEISKIILGNPLNLDGSVSTRCEETMIFKNELEDKYNIEVILEDERLTSVIANNMLIMNNERRNNRKKVVDKLAASIILQSYLDRFNSKKE